MEEEKKIKQKSSLQEWAESIIIAFILAMFIRTFFIQAFKIPSGSMEGTLLVGDFLLVTCDEATEQARLDMAQETVKSMPLGIPDGRPRDDSGWRLRWDTWSSP